MESHVCTRCELKSEVCVLPAGARAPTGAAQTEQNELTSKFLEGKSLEQLVEVSGEVQFAVLNECALKMHDLQRQLNVQRQRADEEAARANHLQAELEKTHAAAAAAQELLAAIGP